MKNKTIFFILVVSFIILSGVAGSAEKIPESDDPIKITIHDWNSQVINSHIMGSLLEKMGSNVEYVMADYIAQFAGLESGDLHVAMEIWETTGKDVLEASLKTGKTIDMEVTGMHAKEEWWYPSYMKEQCPDLPDWKALNKYAEVFATPMTSPKGRYLGGAVTWGGHDEERIEALGLDYKVVHAGTAAALFSELKAAYERKAPILLWVYSPHWVPLKFEGEWIEFPEYTKECYDNPEWGINPDKAYDCGKPEGWIKKVAWAGLKDKWPGAWNAIKNFRIHNDEIAEMIAKVDLEGEKVETVVQNWIQNNKDIWSKWIK
jgi:glycine betaine/proline transport system substrate-binding protein